MSAGAGNPFFASPILGARHGDALHPMPDSSPSLPIREMLDHSGWVRELARRLVRDPLAADDLAQDAWVAALENPPGDGRPLRQWLAKVLRNFARQRRRGEGRRAARETAAAKDEGLPSTAELVERASLQRMVHGAVLGLDEPYRTAILLRYFEELPPREIAKRLGVPVETVHTRLTRAHQKLRVRLDRLHRGDRRAWVLALAPLARRPWALPSSVLGGVLVNASAKLALAALSLAGALGAWYVLRPHPARPEATLAAAPHVAAPQRPGPLAAHAAEVPESAPREPVRAPPAPDPSAPAATPAPPPAAVAPAHGVVLAAAGGPAPGVRVRVRRAEDDREGPVAVSGPDGRWLLEQPPKGGLVVAADDSLSTVLAGALLPGREREPVTVVAPRLPLGGRVVDEEGRPLGSARLSLVLPDGFRTRFDAVLDDSRELSWSASSDADGSFELADLPQVEDAHLVVVHAGFDTRVLELPGRPDPAMEIALQRPRAEGDGFVRGLVVDSLGRPVDGARVAFGVETTTTGADGKFAFLERDPESMNAQLAGDVGAPRTMKALKSGLLPAFYEAPADAQGAPRWPARVVLRLEGEPLEISGRLLGTDGKPLEGARVFVAEASVFGAIDRRPAIVENLLAGATDRTWNWVETDGDGRFVVRGLLDREYRLRAMDAATLLMRETEPIRAGSTDVEIRMPRDALFARVAGRVVNHSGEPVAGARVFPMCDAFRARYLGHVVSTSHDALEGTKTDQEGRFELRGVPKSLVYLRVEGEDILPLEYGRWVEGDPRFANAPAHELPLERIERLEIVVEQRCHLQVTLADPSGADSSPCSTARGTSW